jgi:hypothetical protein
MAVDMNKLQEFLGRFVTDLGATFAAGNVVTGHHLGLSSTQLCVPNALSQPGGYALGARAGEAAIRQMTADAGFTRFRRAAETPVNLVYEVRP